MEILTKNFLVYGYGKTGVSAVNFLLEKGAKNVYVYDDSKHVDIDNAKVIDNFNDVLHLSLEAVILSPGVNIIDNKNIELLKKNNIFYCSEFYLGYKYSRGKKVCITGTNGKTTTVNLIYNICKKKYKDIFLCGNTDTPITQIANKTTNDSLLVCEVSSFALESVHKDFSPDVSAILNITNDHIIRHKTLENYKLSKGNITRYQSKDCYFVCDSDFCVETQANKLCYSKENDDSYIHIKNDYIYCEDKKIFNKKIIKLAGEKNLENVMCATLVSKILFVKNNQIKSAIKKFMPLKHRIQTVANIKDILFVDDSKATNPDSTICALKSIKKPVILLLGGSDKGYCYDEIFLYTQNVKQIVCFGQMGEKIMQCAIKNNFNNNTCFERLKEAVIYAKKIAQSGDVVLLSPACASFDEFSSYKERGDFFAKIVNENN